MEEKDRWILEEEVKNEYIESIQNYLNKADEAIKKGIKRSNLMPDLNLSDTKLNPYTLGLLLTDLGYEEVEVDYNGWELDFWIKYSKRRHSSVTITGTGITFELKLSQRDAYE